MKRILINIILIFCFISCSSYQWERMNRNAWSFDKKLITEKSLKNEKNKKEYFDNLRYGYIKTFQKNKKLTEKEIQLDIEFLNYVIQSVHPRNHTKKLDELNKLKKDLVNIKSNSTNELHKNLIKLFDKYYILGLEAYNYSKFSKDSCPLIKKIEFIDKKIKNDNFAYFKINNPTKDIAQFNKDLTYSMNNKDGLIIDARNYKMINWKVAQLIIAHFYGLELGRDYGVAEQYQYPIKKRFYVHNWITNYYASLKTIGLIETSSFSKKKKKTYTAQVIQSMEEEFNKDKNTLKIFHLNKMQTKRDVKKSAFLKPIYFLVDSSCDRNCEVILQAIRENSNVKVFGSNTKGVANYEDRMIFTLPNSAISIEVPYSYTYFYDKREIENVGYKPDITLSKKQSFLKKLNAIHESKQKDIKPVKETATVTVIRPQFVGSIWTYKMYLNGKKDENIIASTKGTQYVEFEVPLGKNKIYHYAETWSSVEFDAKKSEKYYFIQVPKVVEGASFIGAEIVETSENTVMYFKKVLSKGEVFKN